MEESGQDLKDENRMKDGPVWVLWQSGISMTLHTNVTEKGSHVNKGYTFFFFFPQISGVLEGCVF